MTILGGILIVVLAACVLAWFATRVWHWAYVLFVVGIVLLTAGFFILSAEVLRINTVLRRQYEKTDKQLISVKEQVDALKHGTSDSRVIGELRRLEVKMPEDAPSIPSIGELEHSVRMLTQLRGPMWQNVMPAAAADRTTGTVRIGVVAPEPPGIAPAPPVANSIVYVFEASEPVVGDQPGGKQYLGEFRVNEASGQTATLVPTLDMNTVQLGRLAASRGPWVMYETMPPDRHEIYLGMSEEQLRQKIPADSVEEYIRHGQPALTDDDEFRRAAFDDEGKQLQRDADGNFPPGAKIKYQRRLRDYAQEFRKLVQNRSLMQADKDGLTLDNKQLTDALTSAGRLTTFRQDEIAKLNNDLAGLTKDRQALGTLVGQVQQQLDTVRTLLIQLIQENSRLSRELAALQSAATNALNQSSAAPAAN